MAWSKKRLISTCSLLRDHVVGREMASAEELLDHWPAECSCASQRAQLCPRCRSATKHDWYIAYGHLLGFKKRGEWLEVSQRDESDDKLISQLNADPFEMNLMDGTTITLHPKGFHALRFIQGRDWLCSWLASLEQLIQHHVNEMRLTGDELREPISAIDMIGMEIANQLSIIIGVIAHPGPGLPDDTTNPHEEYLSMLPIDVARINKKFMELNIPQLQLVPYLMGPQKPGKESKRRGWTVFYMRAGKVYDKDPQDLMYNKSLAALLLDMKLRSADLDEFSRAS